VSATARSPSSLVEVARGRADSRLWVALLDAVGEAAAERAWRAAVPDVRAHADGRTPLLTDATIVLDPRVLRRWTRRLLETAAGAGGAATTLAGALRAGTDDHVALFESGLEQDAARLQALAASLGVDAEALAAVAGLVPMPLLRACAERLAEPGESGWTRGYCPVCGAWPLLAEARGLERARRLRCGRCAADWPSAWLTCPYCETVEHTRLGSLVPEATRETRKVDTCGLCHGYVKTITTLAPTPPDELGLIDLATVELDVAALEHGYARPRGLGAPLRMRVRARAAGLLGAWRA
jgi:FdhE protein